MADTQIITLSAPSETDLNTLVSDYISKGWSKVGNMWNSGSFYYQKMAK